LPIFTANMSRNLAARDVKVIWHPFTRQQDMQPPIGISSGKGSLLYDEEGQAYIDAISSWWVTLHGHGHPYIAERIYRQALQLEQVIFAGFTHAPAVELAERLLPLLPGNFDRIFYSDNGSTSTEVALKMALQYWWNKDLKRKKILAFRNAYHGDTFGAMSVSSRGVFNLAFHDHLFEVIFIDTPTLENIDAIKAMIHLQGSEIAAFIYEPLVQGAGGMMMYDAYLLNELLNTVKASDIICIADEVMTGFGRTGSLFASDHLQKKPDIICLSKGLTGGTMALGVTACTEKIYHAFLSADVLKTFFHGHSFTANPIACSAALASLDLLEVPNCGQQVAWICAQNQAMLVKLKANPFFRQARALGTLLAFEILNEEATGYLNSISAAITAYCLRQGIYLRPLGNTVYMMPPYCITPEELEKIYSLLLDLPAMEWSKSAL
jgi:adenosylmethionine---8-amino-7-oxononanoate aminotransferase